MRGRIGVGGRTDAIAGKTTDCRSPRPLPPGAEAGLAVVKTAGINANVAGVDVVAAGTHTVSLLEATLGLRLDTIPLPGSAFGARALLPHGGDLEAAITALEDEPALLGEILCGADGLLLLKNLHEIAANPALLLRLSRLLGPEVEDYRPTHTERGMIHPQVPQVYIVSNLPPASLQPPAQPEPPLAEDGRLPVQFPHRRGWHTDQSFRRPPPDISLFYAVTPAPHGQGQTLYADAAAACDALPASLRERVEGLVGIHAKPGVGRAEYAVLAGEVAMPLQPHQAPQRQPVVRVHPVSGRRSLYLCEAGQMDWVDGPFEGMQPGPHGDGAKLLYELMHHITQPRFTYVHEWDAGDMVIYDNRCVLHCATWFDAARHGRVMWRTTVMGNPGPEYDGEPRSWIAAEETGAVSG